MARRVVKLVFGERSFGNHRPNSGLLGFAGEVFELINGDSELLTGAPEFFARLTESTFDHRTLHRGTFPLAVTDSECTSTLARVPRWSPLLVAMLSLSVIAGACGTDSPPTSSACGSPTNDPLDPASGVHVLDPSSVQFDDPTPTSGPHLSGPGRAGVFDESIPKAAQVTLLEQGGLVIHVDETQPDLVEAAAALAGERVAVHPAPIDSAVIVTAWRTRIACTALDEAYTEWFITDRLGRPDLAPTHE